MSMHRSLRTQRSRPSSSRTSGQQVWARAAPEGVRARCGRVLAGLGTSSCVQGQPGNRSAVRRGRGCREENLLIVDWQSWCPCAHKGQPTVPVCSVLYHMQFQYSCRWYCLGAFFTRYYSRIRPGDLLPGDDLLPRTTHRCRRRWRRARATTRRHWRTRERSEGATDPTGLRWPTVSTIGQPTSTSMAVATSMP